MVLFECACANLVSKANFNLINRTDLFIYLHIIFQISFRNSKGQKSYCKFLGVRSELLLSIYVITKKANQTIGFLKRSIKVHNQYLKSTIYLSLVRPKIKYDSSVWSPRTSAWQLGAPLATTGTPPVLQKCSEISAGSHLTRDA